MRCQDESAEEGKDNCKKFGVFGESARSDADEENDEDRAEELNDCRRSRIGIADGYHVGQLAGCKPEDGIDNHGKVAPAVVEQLLVELRDSTVFDQEKDHRRWCSKEHANGCEPIGIGLVLLHEELATDP